jgi:hypothetical protein
MKYKLNKEFNISCYLYNKKITIIPVIKLEFHKLLHFYILNFGFYFLNFNFLLRIPLCFNWKGIEKENDHYGIDFFSEDYEEKMIELEKKYEL